MSPFSDITSTPKSRRSRLLPALGVLVASAALLAGCADATPQSATGDAGTAEFKPVEQEPGSKITIWVDATRQPAVDAYKAAHPEAVIETVVYQSGGGADDLRTKISLFDRTGEGWPDVVWPGIQDPSWAASGDQPFAAPISELIDKSVLDAYAPGSMDLCAFNGKTYCLRNDLAQDVLWYNKKLMDEFGYEVPTTWEEWEELGLKVAKEHPGYLVGGVGDGSAMGIYFWGGKCPLSDVDDENVLHLDIHNPNCTKMAGILDNLLEAKTLSTVSKFDAGFIEEAGKKILAFPGPSWFGQVLFGETYKVPAGEIAVAPPLQWEGDTEVGTGAGGGGMWFVSSHSKNLEAATDFIQWVTQNPAYTDTAGTYPAYKAAAASWLKKQAEAGYFANDIAPVFTEAADHIWTDGWQQSSAFSQEGIYGETILPGIISGKNFTSQLDEWETAIRNAAEVLGYKVED